MAGTVVIDSNKQKEVEFVTFTWTSDDDGNASGTTTAKYSGCIGRVVIIPDSTDVPTNLYDVQVQDALGIDLLAGAGADCPGAGDTATTVHLTPVTTKKVQTLISDTTLTLSVTNAGKAKKGVVHVFIR